MCPKEGYHACGVHGGAVSCELNHLIDAASYLHHLLHRPPALYIISRPRGFASGCFINTVTESVTPFESYVYADLQKKHICMGSMFAGDGDRGGGSGVVVLPYL